MNNHYSDIAIIVGAIFLAPHLGKDLSIAMGTGFVLCAALSSLWVAIKISFKIEDNK